MNKYFIEALLIGRDKMRKRNIALAEAYAEADKSFKEYRERVTERFGEDLVEKSKD